MNVTDYADVKIPVGNKLCIIFDHQRQLMEKYHDIEEKNLGRKIPSTSWAHQLYCGPLDIQDRDSQLRLKDFYERITEEITEATICLSDNTDKTHFEEELIDALHFMIEFSIMSGVMESDLSHSEDGLEALFAGITVPRVGTLNSSLAHRFIRLNAYQVVEKLGDACNRLKLKPWKSSAILTDINLYRESVKQSFYYLIELLASVGFTAESATKMYLQKNHVNKFRQNSNY